MTTPRAVLAWALSVLPLALVALGERGVDLGRVSLLGLALLPWLALAGLPERDSALGAASRAAWAWNDLAVAGGLMLPPLALAARVDHDTGVPAAELARAALAGLCLLAALALAARHARGAALHALVWTVLVVALPLLGAALGWASAPGAGAPPAWLVAGAGLSPLAWCLGVASETAGLHAGVAPLPLGPAVVAGLCLAAARVGPAAARSRSGSAAEEPE